MVTPFLENLAVDAGGAVFVTVYSHNRVDRYDPGNGTRRLRVALVPAPPMGLAFDAGGDLWVTGGTLYHGPGVIWRIERTGASSRNGCELPDVTFMNGCTMHVVPMRRTLLACDSSSGRILAIDLGQPGRWDVWLQGDLLNPIVPRYPGANGIKVRDRLGVDQRLGTQIIGPRADPGRDGNRRPYSDRGNASVGRRLRDWDVRFDLHHHASRTHSGSPRPVRRSHDTRRHRAGHGWETRRAAPFGRAAGDAEGGSM